MPLVKSRYKTVIDLKTVSSIQKQPKAIIITRNSKEGKEEVVSFADFEKLSEVCDFLSGFWQRRMVKSDSGSGENANLGKSDFYDEDIPEDYLVSPVSPRRVQFNGGSNGGSGGEWLMASEDWAVIYGSAKSAVYSLNDTILIGDAWPNRCLYLVQSGGCKILNGKGKLLWQLSKGDSFGAMGFFLNSVTNKYTVISSEDFTKIRVVEGYFLDLLAYYKPRLTGSFFQYIATELCHKIQAVYRASVERSSSSASLRGSSNGTRSPRTSVDEDSDASVMDTQLLRSSSSSAIPPSSSSTTRVQKQAANTVTFSTTPVTQPSPLRDSATIINISVPRRERKNSRGTPVGSASSLSPRNSHEELTQ